MKNNGSGTFSYTFPTFSEITSKPTTLAGYGITDAITGTGTAGYLAKWTGTTTQGNSIIYNSGTNVGIGTTTATQPLDVAGNININATSAYLFDGNTALKLSKNGEVNYFSTLVGQGSGNAGNINSTRQTALGHFAGESNTVANQTALGFYAGQSNKGVNQTALGYFAGQSNERSTIRSTNWHSTDRRDG